MDKSTYYKRRLSTSYAFLRLFSFLASIIAGTLTVWIFMKSAMFPGNAAVGFGMMGVVFGTLPLFTIGIFGIFFSKIYTSTGNDKYSVFTRVGLVSPFFLSIAISPFSAGIGLVFVIPNLLIYYYSHRYNKRKKLPDAKKQVLLGLLANVVFVIFPFILFYLFELIGKKVAAILNA